MRNGAIIAAALFAAGLSSAALAVTPVDQSGQSNPSATGTNPPSPSNEATSGGSSSQTMSPTDRGISGSSSQPMTSPTERGMNGSSDHPSAAPMPNAGGTPPVPDASDAGSLPSTKPSTGR